MSYFDTTAYDYSPDFIFGQMISYFIDLGAAFEPDMMFSFIGGCEEFNGNNVLKLNSSNCKFGGKADWTSPDIDIFKKGHLYFIEITLW